MILTDKYVSRCNSTRLGTVWIILFLLLNEVKQIYTADDTINITTSTCGAKYDAEFYENLRVEHNGSDVLYDNPCSIEFTKTSSDYYLCVKGEIQLDCGTYLEIHEDFVTNDVPKERNFSCNNAFLEEWCPSQYQDNIYIVIRKPALSTSDVIQLYIYLKEVSPDRPEDDGSVLRIVLTSVLPIGIVIIISVVSICIRLKIVHDHRRRSQATPGGANMPAGYDSPYPTTAGYQPPLTSGPAQQGGQQYPMQTVYPVQQSSAPAQGIKY